MTTHSVLDKIWERTRKTDACWLWEGPVDKNGYGLFRVDGKTARVPRVVYKLTAGKVLRESQHVLHKCDTPACINPTHLFVGTHAQNMRDMATKGRANKPQGEANGRALLTTERAQEIREKAAEGWSQTQLAEFFKVSRGAIYHILARRTWAS